MYVSRYFIPICWALEVVSVTICWKAMLSEVRNIILQSIEPNPRNVKTQTHRSIAYHKSRKKDSGSPCSPSRVHLVSAVTEVVPD